GVLGDEHLVARCLPPGRGRVAGHLEGNGEGLAGPDDGFEDGPDCIGVARRGGSDVHRGEVYSRSVVGGGSRGVPRGSTSGASRGGVAGGHPASRVRLTKCANVSPERDRWTIPYPARIPGQEASRRCAAGPFWCWCSPSPAASAAGAPARPWSASRCSARPGCPRGTSDSSEPCALRGRKKEGRGSSSTARAWWGPKITGWKGPEPSPSAWPTGGGLTVT